MLNLDPELVEQVLADHRSAPIAESLRTTLTFIEKLTLRPDQLSPADIAPMRAAGVSDKAIEEAMYVAFLFNFMDRLADAFDFEIQSEEVTRNVARALQKHGYALASVPG